MIGSLFILWSMLGVQGCAQPQKTVQLERVEPALVSEAEKGEETGKVSMENLALQSGDMYQIMVAEMVALNGFEAQAFDIMYKMAYKLRSSDLAKRAFELSMKTYDAQKIESAANLWRELSPSATSPWRAAFLMALRRNDVNAALSDWEQYRARSKESLERDLLIAAQKVRGLSTAESGVAFMQALVERYPDTWVSYFALALVADGFKQTERALKALEQAKSYQTEAAEPKIHQFLAKLYLQVSPPERGLSVLEAYLKKYPEDWLVQERMARLEVKASRYQDAVMRYQKILQAEPNAYTSRLSLALIQIEQGKFKEAEENLLKVFGQKGYSNVVNYYLGVLNQEMGRQDRALEYYNQVDLNSPYAIDAQLSQAEIYFAKDQMNKALELLNAIQPQQPRDRLKILRAQAVFYSASGQKEQAVKVYGAILSLMPNNVAALMNQAMLFYDLNRMQAYVANLKRVIEINPDETDALNALGYYYADSNQNLSEAEVLLQRAYQLEPESYYILDSIGWLYFRQGQYERAKNYLEKALSIQMDDEVLMHLIQTLWALGEQDEARQLWQKNHKTFLQNEALQGLIKTLEKK